MASKPKAKKKTAKSKIKDRLKYKNEWEYHLYSVDKKEVARLREVKIAGKRYDVFHRVEDNTVYDMGHTYQCSSRRYHIYIDFAGARLPMPLDELIKEGVVVVATKFAFRKN